MNVGHAWRWLGLGAGASVIGGLTLAAFVPIYTDEIVLRMLQARLRLDGFVETSLFPTCGAAFDSAPPAFMWPFRLAAGLVYESMRHPWWVRGVGLGVAAGWLAVLGILLPSALAGHWSRWRLVGTVSGFLGLGLLPFILALNRPEQLMLVGLTMLVLYPMTRQGRGARSPRADWALTAAAVGLAALLLAQHPKSLFFLPVMLGAAWLTLRRPFARLVACAVIAALVPSAMAYWGRFVRCEDPDVLAALALNYASVGSFWQDPLGLVQALWRQLVHPELGAQRYVTQVLLAPPFTSGWVRLDRIGAWWLEPLNQAITVVLAGVSAAALVSSVRAGRRLFRGRLHEPQAVMATALSVSLVTLILVQRVRHFYEAALILPLVGLLALVGVPPGGGGSVLRAAGRVLTVALAILAIGSHIALWLTFAPTIPGILAARAYLASQPYSLAPFGFPEVASQVRAAAAACRIDPSVRQSRLVVDDATYVVLASSVERPLHIAFLDHTRLPSLMRQVGSAGLVAGCHHLPEALRTYALPGSPFCCLPAVGGL